MPKTAIDLNCDLGESFGAYRLGHDDEALRLISSANVACGFHAGDPHVMRKTVTLAAKLGVGIGAHPGLPDLLGFGRRPMAVSPEELHDYFTYQIGALRGFVEAAGAKLQHVKAHGALDSMSNDEHLSRAMCEATREAGAELVWLSPGGKSSGIARSLGLRQVDEFYADRAYNSDRSLVSRRLPGAVLHDLSQIRARIAQALDTETVTTINSAPIAIVFDSICVHGDTAGSLEIIRVVREVCDEPGIAVRPFS